MALQIRVPKITQVRVSRDGIAVVIVANGQRILELPWDAALMVAKAITVQAHRIEEQLKAPAIIKDQALLIRKGIPLGLTNNPAMLDEAGKEAAWNTELRRYLPGGVKSQEAFGAPMIIKHRRKDNGT